MEMRKIDIAGIEAARRAQVPARPCAWPWIPQAAATFSAVSGIESTPVRTASQMQWFRGLQALTAR
jgi:hypothetical protein